MDNAGSFDRLAPLLTNSSILAIDLPGNGFSSSLPRGVNFCDLMCLQVLRLITRHFGWKRIKLLGHSLGGVLCHKYAHYDPTAVEFVVALDWLPVIAHLPFNLERHNEMLRVGLDKFMELDRRLAMGGDPPSYPENVALKKWMDASTFGALNPEVARTLMIRGARRKDDDGTYYYTRDTRQTLLGFLTCYVTGETMELTRKIDCPYLTIENPRTPVPNAMGQLFRRNIIDVLARSSRDFQLVKLDGEHHMHMTEPDVVANVIKPFLDKHDV